VIGRTGFFAHGRARIFTAAAAERKRPDPYYARRLFSRLRIWLALVIALFVLAAGQAQAQTPPVRGEWVGIEVTPTWLQLHTRPDFKPEQSAPRLAVGGAGTLRLPGLLFGDIYWTPLQLGLGVGVPELSVFVHASTEVGWKLPVLDQKFEVGGALGAGLIVVSYAGGCDGDCYAGGGPVVFSPVLRYLVYDGPRVPVRLFSRAMIPLGRPEEPSSHFHAYGMVVLFGLDVGINRLGSVPQTP
jgi:hypothetical protein